MRLSGMISGMDTDYVVSEMMKAERLKINKYSQNKQINLWKQLEYQNMNKSVANFILNSQKNMGLKKTGSTGLMVNQSYKSLDYMRIAMSSSKDVADVRVRGKAENGTFNIEVKDLAENSHKTIKIDDMDIKHTDELRIGDVVVYEGAKDASDKGITTRELVKMINNNKELKDKGVSAFYDAGTKSLFMQGEADLDLSVNAYDKASLQNLDLVLDEDGKLTGDQLIAGENFTAGSTVADIITHFKDNKLVNIKDNGNGKLDVTQRSETMKKADVLASSSSGEVEFTLAKESALISDTIINGKTFPAASTLDQVVDKLMEDHAGKFDNDGKLVLGETINGKYYYRGATKEKVREDLEANLLENNASSFTEAENEKLKSEFKLGDKTFATGTDLATVKNDLEAAGYKVNIRDGKISASKSENVLSESRGKAGSAVINGVEFKGLTRNKIDFNGLEIEMKAEGTSTITVDTNYDEIVDKITGLVDEYNSLLDEVSKTIGQKRYKDYHPLSSDEKEAMKENDVKLWEEKAKSGMLNNDETLKRMLSTTRADIYKNVRGLEGSFSHITQLGITTEKYAKGTAGGKLQINEEKLRAALEQDTDGVMELLFGKGKEENMKPDKNGETKLEAGDTFNGVFTGIYDNMVNSMKDIINKSGPGEDSDLLRDVRSNILIDFVSYKSSISDLDRTVMEMERKMADMEVLLARREDGYYKQFTAMEKALQQMQSQSTWIGQQMM